MDSDHLSDLRCTLQDSCWKSHTAIAEGGLRLDADGDTGAAIEAFGGDLHEHLLRPLKGACFEGGVRFAECAVHGDQIVGSGDGGDADVLVHEMFLLVGV